MDFTFVTLVLSVGLIFGAYFFYCRLEELVENRIAERFDIIEGGCDEWMNIVREDRDALKSSIEKCKVELIKLKDEVDMLKEQKKEIPKPIRKLPLKTSSKLDHE